MWRSVYETEFKMHKILGRRLVNGFRRFGEREVAVDQILVLCPFRRLRQTCSVMQANGKTHLAAASMAPEPKQAANARMVNGAIVAYRTLWGVEVYPFSTGRASIRKMDRYRARIVFYGFTQAPCRNARSIEWVCGI